MPRVAVEIVVTNLLRNARDHARAETVTVTLSADRLAVVDDGVGIPEGELTPVIERGYRGRQAGGSGAGLGLSIVQRLCERYGWRLWMDSAPGRGTRVVWEFGTAAGAQDATPSAAAAR